MFGNQKPPSSSGLLRKLTILRSECLTSFMADYRPLLFNRPEHLQLISAIIDHLNRRARGHTGRPPVSPTAPGFRYHFPPCRGNYPLPRQCPSPASQVRRGSAKEPDIVGRADRGRQMGSPSLAGRVAGFVDT